MIPNVIHDPFRAHTNIWDQITNENVLDSEIVLRVRLSVTWQTVTTQTDRPDCSRDQPGECEAINAETEINRISFLSK